MTNRRFEIGLRDSLVLLPGFFPSISSVKTNLPVLEYVRVLTAVEHPLFLISAYDIYHALPQVRAEIEQLLNGARRGNGVILLDSGNYESYWLRDRTWTPEPFRELLRHGVSHLAFCYDNQYPARDIETVVNEVEQAVLQDQAASSVATIVPIVHGPRDSLPEVIRRVGERLHPLLLAAPERQLGAGIVARARTVAGIRQALNALGYYCPLHLLGTGNPLSILVYSACGADSFDGLEWCQTVVDHVTAHLSHFHHADLFLRQTPIGEKIEIPYEQRVLVHNLVFYTRWMDLIRSALQGGGAIDLLRRYLPSSISADIIASLPRELG